MEGHFCDHRLRRDYADFPRSISRIGIALVNVQMSIMPSFVRSVKSKRTYSIRLMQLSLMSVESGQQPGSPPLVTKTFWICFRLKGTVE